METKVCRDCHIEKSINDFRKNSRQCRKCEAITKKEYYARTREHKLQYTKEYMKRNKEYYKEYRLKHKDKKKEYNKSYYKMNKKQIISDVIKYQTERINNDSVFKLKNQIRKMIYNSFYKFNHNKRKETELIVGINTECLITYLLNTYKNNYGIEWDGIEKVHIDHIKPLKYAKTEEDVIKLCHYTNLQLLKAKDNLEKSSKLNWELKK